MVCPFRFPSTNSTLAPGKGLFRESTTFPVIADQGNHTIKIQGGIKVDGISALRVPYPFYDFYTINADLIPGQVTTLTPTVPYYSGIVSPTYIPWLEPMESAGVTLSNKGEVAIAVDSIDEFEGQRSIKGTFTSADTSLLWQSQDSFLLLTTQNAIFLELNYKCGTAFSVGLKKAGSTASPAFMQVNPSSEWNKIYINITDKFASQQGFYYIYFSKLNDGSATGYSIQLDNIKLLKN